MVILTLSFSKRFFASGEMSFVFVCVCVFGKFFGNEFSEVGEEPEATRVIRHCSFSPFFPKFMRRVRRMSESTSAMSYSKFNAKSTELSMS